MELKCSLGWYTVTILSLKLFQGALLAVWEHDPAAGAMGSMSRQDNVLPTGLGAGGSYIDNSESAMSRDSASALCKVHLERLSRYCSIIANDCLQFLECIDAASDTPGHS